MVITRSHRRPPSAALLPLRELPLELQLHIASELDERTDRASLCLALPSPSATLGSERLGRVSRGHPDVSGTSAATPRSGRQAHTAR